MKKFILTLLIGAFVMTGTAVAQANNTKTAVVYFSATGTTERMAMGAAFKGGKDFTRGSGDEVRKYVEGLK